MCLYLTHELNMICGICEIQAAVPIGKYSALYKRAWDIVDRFVKDVQAPQKSVTQMISDTVTFTNNY